MTPDIFPVLRYKDGHAAIEWLGRRSPRWAVGFLAKGVGEDWFECPKGSFVLVPGGVAHDFENRGGVRAGVLNFSSPGPFEPDMPSIVEWFARNPPGETGT